MQLKNVTVNLSTQHEIEAKVSVDKLRHRTGPTPDHSAYKKGEAGMAVVMFGCRLYDDSSSNFQSDTGANLKNDAVCFWNFLKPQYRDEGKGPE